MIVSEIPAQPVLPQRLFVSLSGTTRQVTLRWCAPNASWILDVADQDGVLVLSGVPLITGADLLAQFEYLNIGGSMVVQTDNDADAVPTFANLGDLGHLFYLTVE